MSKKVKSYIFILTTFPAFSAFAKMLWGLVLVNPMWLTFGTTPSFNSMDMFFEQFGLLKEQSELVWGLVMLFAGILQLLFVVVWFENITMRITAKMLSMWIWLFIAIMLLQSNYQATGGWIYGLIGLYDGVTILRLHLGREKIYDELRVSNITKRHSSDIW